MAPLSAQYFLSTKIVSSYWSIVARNVLSVARNPLRSVSSTKEIVYDLL
jgi:hypothetical protein